MEVVTGAFGYVGRYITAHLLKASREVKTITTHVAMPNPFAAQVSAFAYNLERPDRLAETMRGADTLDNTSWIPPMRG